jgi:hypothetical protein
VKLPNVQARASAMGSTFTGSRMQGSFAGRASAFGSTLNNPSPMRENAGVAAEVEVTGAFFGQPDTAFTRNATVQIPKMLNEIRRLLGNVEDRRKSPRTLTDAPVNLYPISEDGLVSPYFQAQLRDVSAGGLCVVSPQPVNTRYLFVEFAYPEVGGLAILTRLTRAVQVGAEQIIAGRFRTDL